MSAGTSTDDTLAAARALRPAIQTRADDIERLGRVPDDLLRELERAGCCRLFSPSWLTGRTTDFAGALAVIEALAEADASVGWTVSQYALGQSIAGYLPRPSLDAIYAAGPDVRITGAFAPKGRISRTAAGWQVTGRWPFATGCQAAAWIYVQCMIFEDRRLVTNAAQVPVTRLAVLPIADVEIVETWDAVGLRGTGSQDVVVHKRMCAEAWTCALADADGAGDGLQSVPLMDYTGMLLGAVAVGIARGALADIVALAASGKRPAFSRSRLADDELFQDRVGEAEMRLQSARALLHSQAALVSAALAGRTLDPVTRATLRATCQAVTAQAVEAVNAAYELGRSSSIWKSSTLQRRFRDIHTATQHAWNSRDALQHLGATLLASGGG